MLRLFVERRSDTMGRRKVADSSVDRFQPSLISSTSQLLRLSATATRINQNPKILIHLRICTIGRSTSIVAHTYPIERIHRPVLLNVLAAHRLLSRDEPDVFVGGEARNAQCQYGHATAFNVHTAIGKPVDYVLRRPTASY